MRGKSGMRNSENGIRNDDGGVISRGDAKSRRVKLGDVAEEVRGNWTGETKNVPVVGLEHLDPDEIWLRKWEVNPSENTFTKAFRKGQILFGRRRAYQKKLSLAPCDGICSGDITVIAAKGGKVIPELLPFFLRTDKFFDYAIQGSAGSLSPRVKWAHLANYEFNLPPLARQRELAELLWAANDLKESYKKAITATDEMLKAKFREMFGEVRNSEFGIWNADGGVASRGDAEERSGWPIVDFQDVCIRGPQNGFYKKGIERAGNVRVLKMTQLFAHACIDDVSECDMWAVDKEDINKFKLTPNDLLFGRRSLVQEGAGKCRRVGNLSCDVIFESSMIRVTIDTDVALPRFIQLWTESVDGERTIAQMRSGTTVFGIRGRELKTMKIPLPPLPLQREFVAIAERADAAKSALKQSIADIEQVMKGLING